MTSIILALAVAITAAGNEFAGPDVTVTSTAHDATVPVLHCQVPCGIYGDFMRIEAMREDAATIEKGMTRIAAAPKDAQGMNQVVRWIMTKEEHAARIQETVATYWLTQRIKVPATDADAEARALYARRLELLHGTLVSAMKCRQSTDARNVEVLRKNIDAFAAIYFSKDDLEHLKEHRHGHGK